VEGYPRHSHREAISPFAATRVPSTVTAALGYERPIRSFLWQVRSTARKSVRLAPRHCCSAKVVACPRNQLCALHHRVARSLEQPFAFGGETVTTPAATT